MAKEYNAMNIIDVNTAVNADWQATDARRGDRICTEVVWDSRFARCTQIEVIDPDGELQVIKGRGFYRHKYGFAAWYSEFTVGKAGKWAIVAKLKVGLVTLDEMTVDIPVAALTCPNCGFEL